MPHSASEGEEGVVEIRVWTESLIGFRPTRDLPFISSAFVPTDAMATGVRWFAEYQPFTHRRVVARTDNWHPDRQQRRSRRRLVRSHRTGRIPVGARDVQARPLTPSWLATCRAWLRCRTLRGAMSFSGEHGHHEEDGPTTAREG
jgi:hypothetical protein